MYKKTRINVAVIGCGQIGIRHIEAYRNIKEFNLIAVVDIDRKLVKGTAKRYNVKGYTKYSTVIHKDNIDVIDVCSPTESHHIIILEALVNNKHVFCEKPLTYKLEYAYQIKRIQEETGKIIVVGFPYRFHPTIRRLKRILEDNVLGKPYYALFRIGGRGGYRIWKHKKKAGGAIFDMMTHMLDLSDWYFGVVSKAELLSNEIILEQRLIEGKNIRVEAEDFALLKLITTSGIKIFCQADLITPSYMNIVEVHGTNGSFFGSILDYLPTVIYLKKRHGLYDRGKNIFKNSYVFLIEEELRYFMEVLNGLVKPLDNVNSAIRVLKIIEGIKK